METKVKTKLIEFVVADNQPLVRQEMLPMLYGFAPLQFEPTTDIDEEVLLILTAQTLQRPVEWIMPEKRIGRFIQVYYQPIGQIDPDMLICLIPNSQEFMSIMRKFQQERLKPVNNWQKWYTKMMTLAREFIDVLKPLNPTKEEARFVLQWTALIASSGRQ